MNKAPGPSWSLSLEESSGLEVDVVLTRLGSGREGLAAPEVARRLAEAGPNALQTHRVRLWALLVGQFRSALLILLLVTAAISLFVGDRTDATIILVILALSVLLGFWNEYKAARSAEELHKHLEYRAVVERDGKWGECDVTDLVPGDLIRLEMGSMVPADVRLLSATALECDESVLTGESLPVRKSTEALKPGTALGDMTCCAFMGTVVQSGSGEAAVVSTGARTQFGRIAAGLGETQEETEFQAGLRRFSWLLAEVAGVMAGAVLVINLLIGRPVIEALLFSLAIAVGITPQLLPAVVTTSMATGSRRLAAQKVLVKRLVCIEDLGDIELLLTDKTGTLTEGRITFRAALAPDGRPDRELLRLGLLCNEAKGDAGAAVGGNPLDLALWEAPEAGEVSLDGYKQVALVPFDHDRRRVSVLVDGPQGRTFITKGAPEGILTCCNEVPDGANEVLERELAGGSRIVAVATKPASELSAITAQDERELSFAGFLVFVDQPKTSAAGALQRLAKLGVTVKIVTGDHPLVAEKVCRDLGLQVAGTLTGVQVDALDDEALVKQVSQTTIFARVSPEQKGRIIKAHQTTGGDVAYLGDGVNDALALHHADVGISVDSATDVAKDAADIILLEKDLDVLANGVVEGRRIFANTIKYVLMGTSSNFGNIFSAAAASTFLSFLPMLPSQILLNNLLYDTSQLTIPTDTVDEEQLARPSHWDIGFIRRFMMFFGPISSLFDFITFAVMLRVFHAGPTLFRSGWFVESLATQTLVIFVVRTRRVPFFRSRPSRAMLAASLGAVAVGVALPASPLATLLGFRSLPVGYFGALALMTVAYLGLADLAKYEFYRAHKRVIRAGRDRSGRQARRRAARFSHHGR